MAEIVNDAINVAVGVLFKDKRVLLTSRPDSKSYAGYWEFPGGKIESGEDIIGALIRELNEELGVKVQKSACSILTRLVQHYVERTVILHVVSVDSWAGELLACENQELYFQAIGEKCTKYPLLPTTEKILTLLEQR